MKVAAHSMHGEYVKRMPVVRPLAASQHNEWLNAYKNRFLLAFLVHPLVVLSF